MNAGIEPTRPTDRGALFTRALGSAAAAGRGQATRTEDVARGGHHVPPKQQRRLSDNLPKLSLLVDVLTSAGALTSVHATLCFSLKLVALEAAECPARYCWLRYGSVNWMD